MTNDDIFARILEERRRQQFKWAEQGPWGAGDCSAPTIAPAVKCAVLTEECGEVARALLDGDPDGLRRELVQVAAVAVAWLEGL